MTGPEEISNKDLYTKLESLLSLQTEEIKKEFRRENARILEILEEQGDKVKKLEVKCDSLDGDGRRTQKLLRKNNIIVSGCTTDGSADLKGLIAELSERLGVNLTISDVNNFHRLRSQKGALFKVELVSFLKKLEIMKNTHKLKGSSMYVSHDLTIVEREDRKILIKHMKKAKSRGQDARLRGERLVIDGVSFSACHLENRQSQADNTVGPIDNVSSGQHYMAEDCTAGMFDTLLSHSIEDDRSRKDDLSQHSKIVTRQQSQRKK